MANDSTRALRNRIREIRKSKGLSEVAVAEMVGTSREQIGRLERGERQLTQKWMNRIAAALHVRPSDLLHTASLAELTDEVEHVEESELEAYVRPLFHQGIRFYRVVLNNISNVWPAQLGAIVPVSCTDAAVASVKTSDLVLVEINDPNFRRDKGCLVIRQFHAPGLAFTNRPGANTIVSLDDDSVAARLVGVLLPIN